MCFVSYYNNPFKLLPSMYNFIHDDLSFTSFQLIISTFNQLITYGYMCYWKSMGKVIKKNAMLWTMPAQNQSGMHIKFNFPFKNCFMSNNGARVNENSDEGFKSLQY